jgi:hypothetical protein
MVIDEHVTVRLIAIDVGISRVISEDGYRVYDSISKTVLTARGKEDHDKLVEAWMGWKKTKMVLTGTIVISQNRMMPSPQEVKENVAGYAGDPP